MSTTLLTFKKLPSLKYPKKGASRGKPLSNSTKKTLEQRLTANKCLTTAEM